jgi:hypothetical protein
MAKGAPIKKAVRKADTGRRPGAKATAKTKRSTNTRLAVNDIDAWLSSVHPEHHDLVMRIDGLIRKTIPDIQRHIKWRKPSQPEGVPFYGLPGQGWLMAMWSFKNYVSVGLYARGLVPEPPERFVNGRGIKIHAPEQFDEQQMRIWLQQSRELSGWGQGSPELKPK